MVFTLELKKATRERWSFFFQKQEKGVLRKTGSSVDE